MVGNEHWRQIATTDDAEVRKRMAGGYLEGKPFTPYVPTIKLPIAPARALDFGCGLGRSFPYLVFDYVRSSRLRSSRDGRALCPRRFGEPSVVLRADLPGIREEKFDLVFASLVLQHMGENGPRWLYLDDFAEMTEHVYLFNVCRHDFGGSTCALIDRACGRSTRWRSCVTTNVRTGSSASAGSTRPRSPASTMTAISRCC